MAKKRILFLHGSLGGFGDKIRIEEILRFLRKLGHQVREVLIPTLSSDYLKKEGVSAILSSSFPPHKLKLLNFRNLPFQYFNMNLARNYLRKIPRIENYDVVLSETYLLSWIALEVFSACDIPILIDAHGLAGAEALGNCERFWYIKEQLEVEAFRRCTHLFVVSSVMKDYVVNNYKIPSEKVTVIYNGTSKKQTNASYSKPLNVIYAGRFAYWERVDDYLDLAKSANSKVFRFFLAGSGPLEKHLSSRIRTEKIPVKFLGYLPREKMLKFLAKMQLGIAPSTMDITRQVAFPIKILDYLSCGLPVIAPAIGEWGPLLNKKNCGITLEDNKTENYITALNSFLNRDTWEEKSENGLRLVKEEFTWSRVLSPLATIVEETNRS